MDEKSNRINNGVIIPTMTFFVLTSDQNKTFAWIVLTNLLPSVLGALVALAGIYYTAMVQAHLFGRFYWRNRERLDWGI